MSIAIWRRAVNILPGKWNLLGNTLGNLFLRHDLRLALRLVLDDLQRIGPEALHLPQLVERIKAENIEELVLALGSSPEADSTALMIDRMLAGVNVKRTRLARGIPMGSDLEFIDEVTMLRAFEGRVSL